MQKNHKIDNIRAIAIMTVVFGHSIILYSGEWGLYETNITCVLLDYLKRFINLYQMPLFFSLSGYLFAMTWKERKTSTFIVNKLKRLIVPFFSVALLWMIPIKMIVHYPYYANLSYLGAFYKLLNGTDLGHLWYLPTLFLIFIGMYFILKVLGNKKVIWFCVFTGAIILNLMRHYVPYFGLTYLPYICQYFWSFALGAVIYKYEIEKIGGNLKNLCAVLAIVFSILCIFTGKINSLLASILIVTSIYLNVSEKENGIMDAISEYSFGIYLFHSPMIYVTFAYMANANPIIVVILNFLVFGIMAFILTYLIRKTPVKLIIGI